MKKTSPWSFLAGFCVVHHVVVNAANSAEAIYPTDVCIHSSSDWRRSRSRLQSRTAGLHFRNAMIPRSGGTTARSSLPSTTSEGLSLSDRTLDADDANQQGEEADQEDSNPMMGTESSPSGPSRDSMNEMSALAGRVVKATMSALWTVVVTLWKIVSSLWSAMAALTNSSTDGIVSQSSSISSSITAQRLAELEIMDPLPDCLITGTSFTEALDRARREARFLVALTTTMVDSAIQAILSKDVIHIANKKSKKISPNGSFLLWIGDVDTTPANRGKLLVMASSNKILGVSSPPRNRTNGPMLAQYLADIRKRNAKLLLALNKRRQETMWNQERKENYSQSLISDERKRMEKRLALANQQKQAAEAAAREAHFIDRRAILQNELPPEPNHSDEKTASNEEDSPITVAIRLPDGQTAKRRFAPATKASVLFDWADVVFEQPRETISLQTMDGSRTLTLEDTQTDDPSLKEVTLGKKTMAFRVLLQKQ